MTESYGNRRVLIADDEPAAVDALAQLVEERLGCEVTRANDGASALAALSTGSFDVFVSDMVMPGRCGLELISEVNSRWPDVSIIVMTAYAEAFAYVEIIQAGASDFISKPCQLGEMHAKLVRVFKERALTEELRRERLQIQRDREEIEATRAAQNQAEKKYRSLFELSMSGMLLVAPQGHVIRDVNQAFCECFNVSSSQVVGACLFDVFGSSERTRLEEGLGMIAQTGRGTLADIRVVSETAGDAWFDISVTYIHVEPEPVLLLTFKDVTVQREMQQRLADIAQKDGKTGLFNHRAFCTRLEGAMARARKTHQPVTLVFIDIDNFKHCNDTYGHPAGDEVLHLVGELILNNIRSEKDDGFRYGGDEFAILLTGADAEAGRHVAERIRAQFSSAARYETSMSMGVAQMTESMSGDAFVRAADAALYQAKSGGKNMVCVG